MPGPTDTTPPAIRRQAEDADAAAIIADLDAGRRCQAEARKHFLRAGLRLRKKKLELLGDMSPNDPHSPWGGWLTKNVPKSRPTVDRYVRFAEEATLKAGLRVDAGELGRLLGLSWEDLLRRLRVTEEDLEGLWDASRAARPEVAADEGREPAEGDEGDPRPGTGGGGPPATYVAVPAYPDPSGPPPGSKFYARVQFIKTPPSREPGLLPQAEAPEGTEATGPAPAPFKWGELRHHGDDLRSLADDLVRLARRPVAERKPEDVRRLAGRVRALADDLERRLGGGAAPEP
jgi:hypothetical protein